MFRKFNLLNAAKNHANKKWQNNKVTRHEITSVYRKH